MIVSPGASLTRRTKCHLPPHRKAKEGAKKFASARPRAIPRKISRGRVSFSAPELQELAEGLDVEAKRQLNALASARMIRFCKGETLFRVGERFTSLYAIRSGSVKTVLLAEDGYEQVVGYHMSGEIIGIGGVGTGCHGCQAVALEYTDVCMLPCEHIDALADWDCNFQRNLYRLLSREISRDRTHLLLLGTMRAEQRLASFLLDLSRRYEARGYSSCEFVLRMTRQDIGSHLGLKLETISRLFSRFQRDGLLQVEGRIVKLLDRPSMQELVRHD